MYSVDGYRVVSHTEEPSLMDKSYQEFRASWPEFMLHSPSALKSKKLLVELAPDFQFFLLDQHDEVVCICRSVPMFWDGTLESLPSGYDDARQMALERLQSGHITNTLLGLSISVPPTHRSKGLSAVAIKAMKELCNVHSLELLIVPVRPSLKASYPLISIFDYVKWMTFDGLPFDPWLRSHARLGAESLACSNESMTITGTVDEWESWTGLRFPQSGEYVIDGGLSPLTISRELNLGTYHDPNVWVRYRVSDR
jgi:hypothetical protein